MRASVVTPTLAMLAVLTMVSMANYTVAVIAPEAAPDIGVAATDIGLFNAILYGVAMFSGAVTGAFVSRFGAIRVSQFITVCAAAGIGTLVFASPAAAIASAVLLGFAYGPFNPASGQVLAGVSTPRWRPLIFSIKQVGVPLGGALAGAVIAPLTVLFGWRVAALSVCVATALIALSVQPLRRRFDADRSPAPLLKGISVREPLRLVLTHPALRRLVIAGFAYAGCQLSVGAFFVVFLVESMDMALVEAGVVFAFVQTGAVTGRIASGVVAERVFSSRVVLAGLGVLIAICLATTATFTTSWPLPLVTAVGFVLGACSFGWVGVYLSQVASLAPNGRIGEATGGAQFVHFSGAAIVPPCFGAIVAVTGSFTVAFAALAALAMAAGVYLALQMPEVGDQISDE